MSGTQSLGSTSAVARVNERAALQQALAADPKWKKYAQQVERCLNSFDNVHEWADCIAFLKQLLKTFQSYMQFKEIPRKLIVAKRLSQCLNPALPTGVHQRALDVYAHILAVLGTEGLQRDLSLWSLGLFPFFEYAATSVKPTLLNLYDTHYLPLQAGLRPVMKSFILALLPGLEEETGEFFEKVLSLLDRLSGTVSPAFFLQNIWLVMLTTPSARGTALNFLSRRLPRLNAEEDITAIVGRDIGLMIRAFSAGLEDDNLLVRRGALDLLLQSMRADSAAVKRAPPEDRTILMRAATGVVLRRDLSLNRRLYTWLLGPEEKSETQIAYLRDNALDLLQTTLRDEMFSPSADYSESRPFKIFISMLDKWEVGAALTEALVFDAFKAVKHLIESGTESGEEMVMTASTLYEAVEPQVMWKQLLAAVVEDIVTAESRCESIRLAVFILISFSVEDEEIQTIHLPVVFCALSDVMNLHIRADPSRAASMGVHQGLLLQQEILRHIPSSALLQRPELTAEIQAASSSQRAYHFACTFYGIAPHASLNDAGGSNRPPLGVPIAFAFDSLVGLSMTCAVGLAKGSPVLGENYSLALLLLDSLVNRIKPQVDVGWDPVSWLSSVMESLEYEDTTFLVVDRIVSLAVVLHDTQGLQPKLSIDSRPIMYKMVNTLLKYLRPDCAVYHVRAVSLIWSLEAATKSRHVEAILAQSMTSRESRNVHQAYEAFGVLWRSTDDSLLPGIRFKVPMMIVLDTLKSEDPNLRRVGETWMRSSLKSYLRVLDPILFDLLDPAIRRIPTTSKVSGKELQGFVYERPYDQRYVYHLLEMLLSITRFGGQGFAKTARSTPIKRSHNADLIQRVTAVGSVDPEASYMDVLVDIFLRFLQSEPKETMSTQMAPLNAFTQSTTVELLQALIARGEVDPLSVEIVEAAVIGKLYFCVHRTRLDLQNKLLHLLHSLISASTSVLPANPRRRQDSVDDGDSSQEQRVIPVNPLLVQTLIDGIATPNQRPVLQHWLDFILMAVPQFQPTLQGVVGPLNDCVCRQLRLALSDTLQVAKQASGNATASTDAEFIMLLNGLERLILLSITGTETAQWEDENMDKPGPESGGLLGYVSNVFSSEQPALATEEQLTARSPGYRALHEGVRVLFSVWAGMIWTKPPTWSPADDSLSLIYNRTRTRCRRVLEHLFRVRSAEVFESIVDCWNKETVTGKAQDVTAFELVDVLISNAQNVVNMICESISCRVSGVSERSKKQAINPNLSDSVLFKFLEQYLQRLEGPLAIQVWPRFLQLTKEITGNARDYRVQNYPLLRCLCVLAEKLTQTTAMEDRRMRRDLQDSFGKLLDVCVTFVGRSSGEGSWIRRTAKEALTVNGRDSPAPRGDSLKLDEKNGSFTSLADTLKPVGGNDMVLQINQFLATTAIPNLRRFLVDNDKVAASCSNIIYYIVAPAMKGKTRPLDVETVYVDILREMARMPAALKAWKAPVTELINDQRFFNSNAESAGKWKPVIKALFDTDKTAFPELLAKVATAPSANIFTNREYEMLVRSLNLRRLSYVLFTGDKNHFITQLPTIQEKLVDILRNVSAPIVQSEVYLCIRVLLCRLSAHNLTSFWPVLLTELLRLYEHIMSNLPSDGSDDLQLVLSASKCLDLLIVLQTEEFQIHQWMFITDTVDAVYRPDDWFPEAIMEQLSEIAGSLPPPELREGSDSNGLDTSGLNDIAVSPLEVQRPMRRPLLNSLRQIDSIRELVSFFSHVSIASYESVYASGGNVDWVAVEKGIMDDMFDGR